MPSYQVVGAFADPHCPPVCWGGRTCNRTLAEERLQAAREYVTLREKFGGQYIEWEIEEQ